MGIVVLVSRQVIRLLSAADRISSAYRMWAMMNKVDNMRNPGNSKDHLLRSGLKIVLASIIASSQLTVVYSAQGEKTDRDEAGLRGLVKTVATRDVRPIVTIEQFDPSGKLTKTTVKDARRCHKLPRQGDTSKGELLASSWARYMAGGRPANASWGRSSL